ncbi:MAG: protoheme IX farnesyltransferase [Cyclobacteriaceae bacterium]|nr:MAG: protoheme IX farnesyltransferase [Cyclobacteriaceae bacterium]
MIGHTIHEVGTVTFLVERVRAYTELLKPRLSFLVAFSSVFGYFLGTSGILNWPALFMLGLGGFLVSGASVTINQIIERDLDGLMSRTLNRPLPSRRISVTEAVWVAVASALIGLIILLQFTNPLTVSLSVVSLLLYSFAYTPLKRVGPVAVFVGAIPGAFPPLLGWVAATGTLGYEALILFGIQFIWQFPHFWAIAWVSHDDYSKAGFKLLPSAGKKDLHTAIQIMIYTLFLLPMGLLPAKFGLTGINSALVVTVCGVLFLAQTLLLMRDCLLQGESARKSALKIMFGSFIYLPVVQIALILDKI